MSRRQLLDCSNELTFYRKKAVEKKLDPEAQDIQTRINLINFKLENLE